MNWNRQARRTQRGQTGKIVDAVREALERALGMLTPQPRLEPIPVRAGAGRRPPRR